MRLTAKAPKQTVRGAALEAVRACVHSHRAGGRVVNAPLGLNGAGVALASRLELPVADVQEALATLVKQGTVHVTDGSYLVRTKPCGPHPQSLALRDTVRERISAGYYRPGQALPTGLLGLDFTLQPDQVRIGCGFLVREGLLRHKPNGPYGPGYYVTGKGRPS